MLLTQLARRRLIEYQRPEMLVFTQAADGTLYEGATGYQAGPGPLSRADVQRTNARTTIVIVYEEKGNDGND